MHRIAVDTAVPERRNMFFRSDYPPRFLRQKIRIKTKILPIFFPRKCPFCDKIISSSSYICKACVTRLPLIHSPVCYQCGKPLNKEHQELCYDCRTFPKSFDGGLSLFLYNSMTQKAMIAFKYHNARYLADFFVKAICSFHLPQIKTWNIQAIVPIPIHKNKRKKRGYNQTELIASQLALLLNLPCYPDLILRQINTLPQKQFSPQARLNNLHRAFCLNPHYTKDISKDRHTLLPENLRHLLLVDDIYTTGATMESCTRLLKEAGVEKVYVYSLCIGIARDEIM